MFILLHVANATYLWYHSYSLKSIGDGITSIDTGWVEKNQILKGLL